VNSSSILAGVDLPALAPFIVLAATAVVVLLTATFTRSHAVLIALTAAGLAGTLASVLVLAGRGNRRATFLLSMDDYALYFIGLLVVLCAAVVLLSHAYLEHTEDRRADYYLLLLLATLGATVLVASTHFASLLLGLEILSVSLYGLIAYPQTRPTATEAALKYLVLAASTAAFMLMGMAFVYAASGSMALGDLSAFAAVAPGWSRVLYFGGLTLLLTGIGFKLAVAPFHLWTPDVYQGAPAPVTAFVATVSKGAVFALLLRYADQVDPGGGGPLVIVLTVIAFASMAIGNLLALLQENVKRLLAYSSISHLGYLLVALLAGGAAGRTAAAFYLAAYTLTMVTAFGIVTFLSGREGESETLGDYRGLGRRRPWVAGVFTIALLSLAGIPITAGFIGKFFLIRAGVGETQWALVVTLALTSTIGLFYYLRVIVTMYGAGVTEHSAASGAKAGVGPDERSGQDVPQVVPSGGRLAAAVLAVLTIALLALGVYPDGLLRLIERAASTLG
jgi:NADH-quinone oxidoreductase subunit N